MADDQVKYSELIVDDTNDFAGLLKALDDVKSKLAEVKGEATRLGSEMKNLGTATREQQQATAANAAAAERLQKQASDLTAKEAALIAKLEQLREAQNKNLAGWTMLVRSIDGTNMSYNQMKATADALEKQLRSLTTEEEKNSMGAQSVRDAISRLRDAMKSFNSTAADAVKSNKAYKKLTDEEIRSLEELKAALQGTKMQQIEAVQAIDIQNKSYNELYQTYNAIKDVLNGMTVAERENSEAGKLMINRAKEIRDTLNNLQQQTGNYTLNVGNYMSAMNGLQFQAQQLMREIPSALNIQQFFLAISNNIPMFADALSRWNKELPGIRSKIEAINGEIDIQRSKLSTLVEGSDAYIAKQEDIRRLQAQQNDLQKLNVGGWRAILKAVGSWQTLLIGGLLLLRNWKSVTESIKNLFVRMTDEQKMFKAVNEEAASSVGNMTAKFQALQKEWQELKAENQGEWLKQHKDDWNELGISIDNANDAENLYVQNTSIIQKAIDDRARSIAAMKLATEKYEEAFKKQVEAEQGLQNRQSGFWSQVARGVAGAGMSEATGVLTPEQVTSQTRAEEQAIQSLYNKRMAEVAKLKDEAQQMIQSFVLPEQGKNKPEKEKKPKSPKDQVADLLTLTRQLEDQIIANIEDEYTSLDQTEIKRHERFIEDREAELKLLSAKDPRRAVINKQIEEEEETHINKMFEIDEKRRQELIKLSEEEEKIREKAAKENAKSELKAMADGWQKQRAELIEQGATRHKLIEEEVKAEIARLNAMIELNRTVNGEIMSDEEKEKVKEWIKLLEQIQQKGDYSNIKPGQIAGKGGSNISTGKKNYNNIWEVLQIDIDQNQISALNSVFDQAKEALNSWMDARKDAADQAKELADDEVAAAENALNREIELRNQGYANDVALREKELADAKAAQEKAVEEQKKIAGQQILLDAALQTSSMITASANIFKQFPNPALWIPMLGILWGTFGYAKLKAYQASQKSIKFKEGGVMLLEGGSHESGHDVNLGIGPDGSNLRAEGGEYFAVINKRSSRKYGNQIPAVVNALNSGMFEDRYIKTSDTMGLMGNVGVVGNVGESADLSRLESGVGELVKQGEQNWTIEGGYRVLRYKNLTRRVKIG